jgi:septal ring factor EnvC (AmiA/AmiB activator)
MKKAFLFFSTCLLVTAASAQPQTKEELQKKESDLKKEITELASLLTRKQGEKKLGIKQAAAIQRKIAAREELVNNISKQVKAIDETIYRNELDIYRMKKELDTLKAKYAQSIVFAYKNRSSYQYLNFLFSANSFNDALKRMTYLRSYRQLRETQVDNIIKTQAVLRQKSDALTMDRKEQTQVLDNQKGQLKELEQDKKEKDQLVKELKSQEKDITAQLRKKEKQRQDMHRTLLAVIRRIEEENAKKALAEKKRLADEEKRKSAEKNKPNEAVAKIEPSKSQPNKTQAKPSSDEPQTGLAGGNAAVREYTKFEGSEEGKEMSINFEKRNLPWPVSVGSIVLPFGPYNLGKIVGVNDGIDIGVPVGTPVKAVADGKVSYVGDVGGEQVVIVKHGKYLTSYGHLSSVSVSKDQTVKAGTVLGKSGTDDEGQGMMQFMVTNDKGTPLNPKNWLRAR